MCPDSWTATTRTHTTTCNVVEGDAGERRSAKYFSPPFGHLKVKKNNNTKLGVTRWSFLLIRTAANTCTKIAASSYPIDAGVRLSNLVEGIAVAKQSDFASLELGLVSDDVVSVSHGTRRRRWCAGDVTHQRRCTSWACAAKSPRTVDGADCSAPGRGRTAACGRTVHHSSSGRLDHNAATLASLATVWRHLLNRTRGRMP